jgi:hypothetical protein
MAVPTALRATAVLTEATAEVVAVVM